MKKIQLLGVGLITVVVAVIVGANLFTQVGNQEQTGHITPPPPCEIFMVTKIHISEPGDNYIATIVGNDKISGKEFIFKVTEDSYPTYRIGDRFIICPDEPPRKMP